MPKTNMMVIVTYPNDKATEMGQAYLKNLANFPKNVKRIGGTPYVTANDEGIQTISIFEVKDENLADAMRGITAYYTAYNEIPGYRWEFHFVMTAMDALPLIGLKPPET